MIFCGTDIVLISRFDEKKPAYRRFLDLCFTKREQEYCESRGCAAMHYAARFAGKEAAIKAFSGLNVMAVMTDIEILNRYDGRPYMVFSETLIARMKDAGVDCETLSYDISLSHSDENATAFVVIMRN